jgi:hypothetical protein
MDCLENISKGIVSKCTTQPVAGLESVAYIINRKDIAVATPDNTVASKITDLSLKPTKKAYKLEGVKKNINGGFDSVIAIDRATRYIHKCNFPIFEGDAASAANADALDDLVIIVETKEKYDGGDGTFNILGLKNGLYKSAYSRVYNDADGVRTIELSSMEGEGEEHSQWTLLDTDYLTTKALVEGLLTPAV